MSEFNGSTADDLRRDILAHLRANPDAPELTTEQTEAAEAAVKSKDAADTLHLSAIMRTPADRASKADRDALTRMSQEGLARL